MSQLIHLKSIADLSRLLNDKANKHPLIAIVDFSQTSEQIQEETKITTDFYSVMFKNSSADKILSSVDCTIRIPSGSRLFVGSSSIRTLDWESIILESMHRTFSPPESTLIFLRASSPENSMRPREVRAKLSPSVGGENCRSHSIRFLSLLK